MMLTIKITRNTATSIARGARRDLLTGNPGSVLRAVKTLEEIENSARHALAASLPAVEESEPIYSQIARGG